MIASQEALLRMVEKLAGETVLAWDLEADSLHHYREKVCLIQIATSEEVFLVDPLAVPDLSSWPLSWKTRQFARFFTVPTMISAPSTGIFPSVSIICSIP
jgi:hypothetical protein